MTSKSIDQRIDLVRKLLQDAKKSVELCTTDEFWALMDLLEEDYNSKTETGFWSNRKQLLQAFHDDRLYILNFKETDALFENRDIVRCFELPDCPMTLQSFCSMDEDDDTIIDMIWTHPDSRRLGFASEFVKHFKTTTVKQIVYESRPFWDSLKVSYPDPGYLVDDQMMTLLQVYDTPSFHRIQKQKELTSTKRFFIPSSKAKLLLSKNE